MAYQNYHIRLDAALASQLHDFCECWGQPISAVVRDAVCYLLQHPEIYVEVLAARLGGALAIPTPEQALAAERLLASLGQGGPDMPIGGDLKVSMETDTDVPVEGDLKVG
jgi:hypothetical protein